MTKAASFAGTRCWPALPTASKSGGGGVSGGAVPVLGVVLGNLGSGVIGASSFGGSAFLGVMGVAWPTVMELVFVLDTAEFVFAVGANIAEVTAFAGTLLGSADCGFGPGTFAPGFGFGLALGADLAALGPPSALPLKS